MKVTIETDYVKPNINIRDGDIITFLDEGRYRDGEYGRYLEINVRLPNGEEKKLTPNNTSVANMVELYGDDTVEWIGEDARVNLVKQMVSKEMKTVLYLTPPDEDMEGNKILDAGSTTNTGASSSTAEDTLTPPDDDIDPEDIPFD